MAKMSTAGMPLAVITGACGGMGIACSRVMGRHHRLVLADVSAERLEALGRDLTMEGAVVAALTPGDISMPATIGAIVDAIKTQGPLRSLIHTAGLSPVLAGWQAIIEVNIVAVVRLLDALEPELTPGAAAVLVASMAGILAPGDPAIDDLLDHHVLDPDLMTRLEPLLRAAHDQGHPELFASTAYAQSKRAVHRLRNHRVAAWGKKGARIVTISPGMISTPMARKEVAENPRAMGLVEMTPLGRWGMPQDIANMAEFATSDLASFLSGCDFRVDGGVASILEQSGLPPLPEG